MHYNDDHNSDNSFFAIAGRPLMTKNDAYFILGNFGYTNTGSPIVKDRKAEDYVMRPEILDRAALLLEFDRNKMSAKPISLEAIGGLVLEAAPRDGLGFVTAFRNGLKMVDMTRANGFIALDGSDDFLDERVKTTTRTPCYETIVELGKQLEKTVRADLVDYINENFGGKKKVTAFDGYEDSIQNLWGTRENPRDPRKAVIKPI